LKKLLQDFESGTKRPLESTEKQGPVNKRLFPSPNYSEDDVGPVSLENTMQELLLKLLTPPPAEPEVASSAPAAPAGASSFQDLIRQHLAALSPPPAKSAPATPAPATPAPVAAASFHQPSFEDLLRQHFTPLSTPAPVIPPVFTPATPAPPHLQNMSLMSPAHHQQQSQVRKDRIKGHLTSKKQRDEIEFLKSKISNFEDDEMVDKIERDIVDYFSSSGTDESYYR
jgi:hypothetical protein